MATYLLAWNPRRWQWTDLPDRAAEVARGGATIQRWSCGSAKGIKVGDRAFLIRLGVEPKGIVGAGTVVRERFEGPHFEPARAAQGDIVSRIEVRFDTLLDPDKQPLLAWEFLCTVAPFSIVRWDIRMSGVRIPNPVAVALEEEWARFTEGGDAWPPREPEW
jgi:5-methylcytosine-specific restriction protein A